MMQFSDLVRLQKRLPPDCPIRLIPFVNDPLAFVGEKNLDADVEVLKAYLSNTSAGDPVLNDALSSIGENLALIRKAEQVLAGLGEEGKKAFPGFECAARSSLHQSDAGISNTLYFDAFKEAGGVELTFQANFSLDLKTVCAGVLAVSKKPDARIKAAMQNSGQKGGWRLKEIAGPGGHAYVLEKAVGSGETASETLKQGSNAAREIDRALSAGD